MHLMYATPFAIIFRGSVIVTRTQDCEYQYSVTGAVSTHKIVKSKFSNRWGSVVAILPHFTFTIEVFQTTRHELPHYVTLIDVHPLVLLKTDPTGDRSVTLHRVKQTTV